MKLKNTPQGRALLQWLRENRKANGLTMRDVALRLKVPHSWIGKIEIGDRRLDVLEYVKLCRVIGADPHKGLKLLEGVKKVKAGKR